MGLGDPLRFSVVRPGDLVRLVSPASWPDQALVDMWVAVLRSWGLQVDVGSHAQSRWGYMAGRDEQRLDDLNAAYRDPDVRAIITTRGRAGAYRLMDDIDVGAVRRDPKPLVGFSDITYLHLALWERVRMPGIHGCVVGARAAATTRGLLMTDEPAVLHRDEASTTADLSTNGHAEGVLIGGNLMALATSVGAGLPSLDGAIVLLETERPAGLGLGFIDRQLTQLIRSGALEGARGIALGRFPGDEGYVDRGWTLTDVVGDRLGRLGFPILGGLEIGHGDDPLATALGTTARLDADAGTLTVASAAAR